MSKKKKPVPPKKVKSSRKGDSITTPKKKPKTSSSNGADRQLILSFPGRIMPMALILHPALELDEWAPVGIRLRQVKEWLQFAIGDWLNHGEAHYGEMYSQAATDTGMPEETLMILKYVSSRVAPESRIKDLTWSHHREVAKFPPEEQTRWLEMALQEHWSVRDLREALKKAAGKGRDGQGEGEDQEGGEAGPQTGEGCESCGGSPAGMRACGQCMALATKALETVGIRGAMDLLRRKPSKPQLEMLKWAYEYIVQPAEMSEEDAVEWSARYDALGKVAAKAAQ